jgi:retron-type reverse transcriptase
MKMQEQLILGTYKYSPAKYIKIFKQKKAYQKLIISNFRDKIIQQAFLQVLNPL